MEIYSVMIHPLSFSAAADASQDYTLVSGSSINGVTSITFRRLLDTGDANDRVIVPGNMSVNWCGFISFFFSTPLIQKGPLCLRDTPRV
jgi:hypothetical protein